MLKHRPHTIHNSFVHFDEELALETSAFWIFLQKQRLALTFAPSKSPQVFVF